MKKSKFFFASLKMSFYKIHLIDRCLIIFMLVLLGQSAYSLFFSGEMAAEGNAIDIIIRTSTAAIFGYFLSANFIGHESLRNKSCPINQPVKKENQDLHAENAGGEPPSPVAAPLQGGEEEHTMPLEEEDLRPTATNLQILTAAGVGLFCLIALILAWDFGVIRDSHSSTAIVAQFRDFISGSIGFLIGTPTGKRG